MTVKQSFTDKELGLTVEPIGPCLGAQILGLDINQKLDEKVFEFVRQALADHELIIIPEQDAPADAFVRFGRGVGELTVHPFSPNADETPELIILDNDGDNEPLATDVWHSDETFRAEPPMATILRSTITPALGGDTLFASMTAAYDRLSERMKAHIEGLEAIHDFVPFRNIFADTPEERARLRAMEDRYPRVAHPIVRVHPVTGKKVLFVNRQFTVGIKDMAQREADLLLEYLYRQVDIPEVQFRVQWQRWPNGIVLWDNRSTQHYAARDYLPQRRRMERVTVKGDRPYGPVDEGQASAMAAPAADGAAASTPKQGQRPLRQAFREETAKES